MRGHQLTDPFCNFQYQEVTVQFSFHLLPEYSYLGPPPLIFICIGFNVTKTSKEKQKVILKIDKNSSSSTHFILLIFYIFGTLTLNNP